MTWIKSHGTPALSLMLSDFTNASLDGLSMADLRAIARQFRFVTKQMPTVHLVSIMPDDLTFGLGRMWQTYVEQYCRNTYLAKTHEQADTIINTILRTPRTGRNRFQPHSLNQD